MGGDIGYKPHTPEGSIFWFTLPYIAAPDTSYTEMETAV